MSDIINRRLIDNFFESLDERSKLSVVEAADKIIAAKEKGGKVAVVTGSGPNIHEGVTTLIAELMDKGIVDGVTTSSAVIGHEMGGALDKVHAVDATGLGLNEKDMPRGNVFEITKLSPAEIEVLKKEMLIDEELMRKGLAMQGREILKAAGNMAYPMGLRGEMLALEILALCKTSGIYFERVAGFGCDEKTMMGIAAKKGLPCLVSVPQLVGSGMVGISIADSISMFERCTKVAKLLDDADVIIESAVALTQEIHDGPFENYTGHGIWSNWQGHYTYSLREKTLIRFDLDENLRKAQDIQKESKMIQEAIDKGLPKTKLAKIPFRMEMSAFARHEGSIPVIGDIGKIWPVVAVRVADKLGIKLDFMSYAQDTEEGKAMRQWIVENVKPLDKEKMVAKVREILMTQK